MYLHHFCFCNYIIIKKIFNYIMEKNIIKNNDAIIMYSTSKLFTKYLYDIKNIQTLNEEMINNIRNMTSEEKMDIIIALNDVINNFKFILE